MGIAGEELRGAASPGVFSSSTVVGLFRAACVRLSSEPPKARQPHQS